MGGGGGCCTIILCGKVHIKFLHHSHAYRHRVVEHYLIRCQGNHQLLESFNLIGRTSEFSRLYGIEFESVVNRGSQYRVESMMLRLAKPANFVPVSPSVQQRARSEFT